MVLTCVLFLLHFDNTNLPITVTVNCWKKDVIEN